MQKLVKRIRKAKLIWKKARHVMGGYSLKFLLAYYLHQRMYIKIIGKKKFKIEIYGHPFYLRTFSRDLDFAYSILIGSETNGNMSGEYDIGFVDDVDGILDLGANIGLFTVLYALRYPDIKIISVEPEDENFELLTLNTRNLKNIVRYHNGIWYREAYVKVQPSRVVIETSHTGSEGAYYIKECGEEEEGAIQGISIENLVRENSMEKYVIKMDIEGTEKDIYEDIGFGWIDNCKMLFMETHERFFPGSQLDRKIREKMVSCNYKEEIKGENKIYRKCKN